MRRGHLFTGVFKSEGVSSALLSLISSSLASSTFLFLFWGPFPFFPVKQVSDKIIDIWWIDREQFYLVWKTNFSRIIMKIRSKKCQPLCRVLFRSSPLSLLVWAVFSPSSFVSLSFLSSFKYITIQRLKKMRVQKEKPLPYSHPLPHFSDEHTTESRLPRFHPSHSGTWSSRIASVNDWNYSIIDSCQ